MGKIFRNYFLCNFLLRKTILWSFDREKKFAIYDDDEMNPVFCPVSDFNIVFQCHWIMALVMKQLFNGMDPLLNVKKEFEIQLFQLWSPN